MASTTYHEIDKPPEPRGTPEEQIRQMYKYLYRLAEKLEYIINDMAKGADD